MTLEDSERETILAAFRFHRFNKTQTAASLNVAIRTLDYKIARYRELGFLKEEERYEIRVPG